MAQFISKVFIVVEAESDAEACDAMSAMLTENLKYEGHLVDWSYVPDGALWTEPYETTGPVDDDGDELEAAYDAARAKAIAVSA